MADNFENMSKAEQEAEEKARKEEKKKEDNDNFAQMSKSERKAQKEEEEAKRKEAQKAKAKSKNKSSNKSNKPKVPKENTSNLPSGQGDTIAKKDNKADGNITGAYRATIPTTNDGSVKRSYIVFSANFWSQIGEVHASYTIGRPDNSVDQTDVSQGIQDELLSFTSRVDSQDNVPTFQIQLSGMRDWDNILLPNDYVEIKASIFDKSGNYVTMNDNTIYRAKDRLIISGLISSIEKTGSSTGGRVYNIACQGMAKILENIHLGLPSDLEANQGYLIYDIGQDSDPANNKLDARGNVDGSGSWDGKIPKTASEGIKKIEKACLTYGAKYHVLPSLCIACAYAETGFGTDPNSSIGAGYKTNNMWGLEGSSVGYGMRGGANDCVFRDYDQGVEYWMSSVSKQSPGYPHHWGLLNLNVKGVTNFSKAAHILVDPPSKYMQGKTNYYTNMMTAYHKYHLARYDHQVNI